jgi:hypothetical protein
MELREGLPAVRPFALLRERVLPALERRRADLEKMCDPAMGRPKTRRTPSTAPSITSPGPRKPAPPAPCPGCCDEYDETCVHIETKFVAAVEFRFPFTQKDPLLALGLVCRVGVTLEGDMEKEIGAHQALVNVGCGKQVAIAGEIIVCELEKEIDGTPLIDKGFGAGTEFARRVERVEKIAHSREAYGSRTAVAECGKEASGGFCPRLIREILKGGGYGFALVMHDRVPSG